MTTLTINDLPRNESLGRDAMAAVCGGWMKLWQSVSPSIRFFPSIRFIPLIRFFPSIRFMWAACAGTHGKAD